MTELVCDFITRQFHPWHGFWVHWLQDCQCLLTNSQLNQLFPQTVMINSVKCFLKSTWHNKIVLYSLNTLSICVFSSPIFAEAKLCFWCIGVVLQFPNVNSLPITFKRVIPCRSSPDLMTLLNRIASILVRVCILHGLWILLVILHLNSPCVSGPYSQDFHKGGYMSVWCVYMYVYMHARLGDAPLRNIDFYKLDALRFLLRPFWEYLLHLCYWCFPIKVWYICTPLRHLVAHSIHYFFSYVLDVYQQHNEKLQLNSLVWGSLTLASITPILCQDSSCNSYAYFKSWIGPLDPILCMFVKYNPL